jgi:CheY-like chemotaxis protein
MTAIKSILVIDDNPINRILPGLILRPFGWVVYEAESGFDAFKRLREVKVCYILLDISMPNIDGLIVLDYLRKNPIDPVKIIAYTAYAAESDIANLLARGFDAVLLKPLTSKKLLSILK